MHLKKLHRAEGGTKFFGVFRVEKSYFFPILGGGGAPPSSAPAIYAGKNDSLRYCILYSASIKCCDIFIYIYFENIYLYILHTGFVCYVVFTAQQSLIKI